MSEPLTIELKDFTLQATDLGLFIASHGREKHSAIVPWAEIERLMPHLVRPATPLPPFPVPTDTTHVGPTIEQERRIGRKMLYVPDEP